jgi:DUF4097 and DUF4098 domain-containing protein YvlB
MSSTASKQQQDVPPLFVASDVPPRRVDSSDSSSSSSESDESDNKELSEENEEASDTTSGSENKGRKISPDKDEDMPSGDEDDDESEVDLSEALARMQNDSDDENKRRKDLDNGAPKTEHEVDAYKAPFNELEASFNISLSVQERERFRLAAADAGHDSQSESFELAVVRTILLDAERQIVSISCSFSHDSIFMLFFRPAMLSVT